MRPRDDEEMFFAMVLLWCITFALVTLLGMSLKGCADEDNTDATHSSADGWR